MWNGKVRNSYSHEIDTLLLKRHLRVSFYTVLPPHKRKISRTCPLRLWMCLPVTLAYNNGILYLDQFILHESLFCDKILKSIKWGEKFSSRLRLIDEGTKAGRFRKENNQERSGADEGDWLHGRDIYPIYKRRRRRTPRAAQPLRLKARAVHQSLCQ